MGNEILLIHLGGLGDVCLSESTFYSLFSHFGRKVDAVGYKRFLRLFDQYFARVLSVDDRSWLWLFSDLPCDKRWQQVLLIGKDKRGEMRNRLGAVSTKPPLFIDMYPEEEMTHVEDYQFSQLPRLGIKPQKKEIAELSRNRIILYPERGYTKKKWPYEHFIALYNLLKDKGVDVALLEAPDMEPSLADSRRFDDLKDSVRFLGDGGLFFSNDSGVAHLVQPMAWRRSRSSGDDDPAIWHPRGRNVSIRCDARSPGVEEMLSLILKVREKD